MCATAHQRNTHASHFSTVEKQVVGVQRAWHGKWEVTALLDGYFEALPDYMSATPDDLMRTAHRWFLEGPHRVPVICFHLTDGTRSILVDAGTSTRMFPTLGALSPALAHAGIRTADVTDILITHLHPDHVNGIATANGQRAFPTATIHVERSEWHYWIHGDFTEATPNLQVSAREARHAVAACSGQFQLFDAGDTLLGDVVSVAMPGHTIGHTGFMLECRSLFFVGDLLHLIPHQLDYPSMRVIFDVDHEQAAVTRTRVLAELVENRQRIAGAHIPFPGIGHIIGREGRYEFVADAWQFAPSVYKNDQPLT